MGKKRIESLTMSVGYKVNDAFAVRRKLMKDRPDWTHEVLPYGKKFKVVSTRYR